MTYRIGTSSPLDDDDNCKLLFGYDPRSSYNPGADVVQTLAGSLAYVGYPVVTWQFSGLTVAQWSALITLIGGYSGEVYVEVRDDEDAWTQWRAMARLPQPNTLDRWGSVYRGVVVEFSLLEDVTV